MELPVKYIWTHDAFRVGEDGPTHEPIEQEAQLRLMEEINNFSGRPSMLVLRPAGLQERAGEIIGCERVCLFEEAVGLVAVGEVGRGYYHVAYFFGEY